MEECNHPAARASESAFAGLDRLRLAPDLPDSADGHHELVYGNCPACHSTLVIRADPDGALVTSLRRALRSRADILAERRASVEELCQERDPAARAMIDWHLQALDVELATVCRLWERVGVAAYSPYRQVDEAEDDS